MLIGFAGAPCSGKTTLAAKLFVHLLEMGIPCEFISEAAKDKIVEKRLICGELVELTPRDNLDVYLLQEKKEKTYVNGCPSEIAIVSDGSIVNSLLYPIETLNSEEHKKLESFILTEAKKLYDVLFLCSPVPHPTTFEHPNRLHNYEESLEKHERLLQLVEEYEVPHILLGGPIEIRRTTALSAVLEKHLS